MKNETAAQAQASAEPTQAMIDAATRAFLLRDRLHATTTPWESVMADVLRAALSAQHGAPAALSSELAGLTSAEIQLLANYLDPSDVGTIDLDVAQRIGKKLRQLLGGGNG